MSYFFTLLTLLPSGAQSPSFPRTTGSITISPPQSCQHIIRYSDTSQPGEQNEQTHWGNLMYAESNGAGSIFLSSCPIPGEGQNRRCFNFFRGTIEELCEGEKAALRTKVASGIFFDGVGLVASAGTSTLIRRAAQSAASRAVDSAGQSEMRTALGNNCPFTERLAKNMANPIDRISPTNQLVRENEFFEIQPSAQTDASCRLDNMVAMLSAIHTQSNLNEIRTEPRVSVAREPIAQSFDYRVSVENRGVWYDRFLIQGNRRTAPTRNQPHVQPISIGAGAAR